MTRAWTSVTPNVRGIVCVVAGMVVFSSQDAAIKTLSSEYPLHEIIVGRSLVALFLTFALVSVTVGTRALRTRRPGWHVVRASLLVTMNLSYFIALAALPIAETMGIYFVAPLVLTMLSAVILRERIGPRRLGAVIIGLIGMLLIVRPGGDIWRPIALLPLLAACCYAFMQISTRYLARTESTFAMAFYAQLGFFIAAGTFGAVTGNGQFAGSSHPSAEFLLRAWSWPDLTAAGLIVFCGVAVAVGALLLSEAYRTAEVAAVAPFEYAALPAGMLWGYAVFGDLPDAIALAGIALIAGSGVYVFFREQRLRRTERGGA